MTTYSCSLDHGNYSQEMKGYLAGSERGKPFIYLPESDEVDSFIACLKGIAVGGGLSLLFKGLTIVTGFSAFGCGALAYCVHKLFRDRQLSVQYAPVAVRGLTLVQQSVQLQRLEQRFQIAIPLSEQRNAALYVTQIDTHAQELANDMRRQCLAIYQSHLSSVVCKNSPEQAQQEMQARLDTIDNSIHALDGTFQRIKAGDKPS